MSGMTRDELIAALEAATGPSFALDVAFCRWLFGYGPDNPLWYCLPYSSSLDAALTALLEGWAWRVQSNGLAAVCPPGYDASDYAKGATPAIALLIAILKSGEEKES